MHLCQTTCHAACTEKRSEGCTTPCARRQVCIEKRWPIGTSVRVLFDDRLKYPGTVTAWHRKSGRCTVVFEDGDVHPDIAPDELLPVPPGEALRTTEPATVISPTDRQLLAAEARAAQEQHATEPQSLPRRSIAPHSCPGGDYHCGGDLCFPNLTLAHAEYGHKIPLFVMVPGAAAAFDAATLCHGSTEHDRPGDRATGCLAHISFACQTPSAVLGLRTEAERLAVHREMVGGIGQKDAASHWSDADVVWLPVFQFSGVPAPEGYLKYEPEHMQPLPFCRIALYDAESGHVLVFFDANGGLVKGLPGEPASLARRHFGFLHDDEWRWLLHRQRAGSGRLGCLHIDGRSRQRMVMMGLRCSLRNKRQRPDGGRSGECVRFRAEPVHAVRAVRAAVVYCTRGREACYKAGPKPSFVRHRPTPCQSARRPGRLCGAH